MARHLGKVLAVAGWLLLAQIFCMAIGLLGSSCLGLSNFLVGRRRVLFDSRMPSWQVLHCFVASELDPSLLRATESLSCCAVEAVRLRISTILEQG